MDLLISILLFTSLISIAYLIFVNKTYSKKIEDLAIRNSQFLESIEKYIEIFNEQNINELISSRNSDQQILANGKIESIKNEYRLKLSPQNEELSQEQHMLIDFVTLSLSLLIKTPPTLRENLIMENTDNDIIKKILISKLPSIQNHYVPVSILEIAISKSE